MKLAWSIIKVLVIIYLKISGLISSIFKKDVLSHKWTTYGKFYEDHKYDSKKLLIRYICDISGKINKNGGEIDKPFYKDLRSKSKKQLLKTLCILHIIYSKNEVNKKKGDK